MVRPRLRDLDAWERWLLVDPGHWWGALLGFVAAACIGHMIADGCDDRVRIAGTALEVLGLALVAIGIVRTRESFDRPSIVQQVVDFWARRPWAPTRGSNMISGSMSVTCGTDGMLATGEVIDANESLAARLDRLERKLYQHEHVHRELRQSVKDARAAASSEVANEARERERADATVRTLIEDVAAGGLHLEAVGLAWLLVGAFATNMGDEVVRWFNGALTFVKLCAPA